MFGSAAIVFLFCNILMFSFPSSSFPLCTNQQAPLLPKKPLSFCPYSGSICCDSANDQQLNKQFEAMKISKNTTCASLVHSILCATCDQFSAQLYKDASRTQLVPLLCNSTLALNSSPTNESFCSNVWEACQDVLISNSLFAPSLQGSAGVPNNSSAFKLTDHWQSKTDFCNAFGGSSSDSSLCFDGGPVSLEDNATIDPPKGMCLEKISDGGYLNMVAHPDGSNRVFLSDQPGKIWLASVPEQGSGEELGLDKSKPFVDLTDQVYYETIYGMMGMAFHPKFASNGRFFASFNCDKVKSPDCSGRCSCNLEVNCDPSKISASSSDAPCRYHAVIAEFSALGSASEPSLATTAKPFEVRRIFTMGLPNKDDHGGQILFGPSDGYLYFMMGDGGGRDDPNNFAQNKKSVLGKIIRLDVDNIPSAQETEDLSLWGNYTIPKDNPYFKDKDFAPEIWALGLRNPWRCSFDIERPPYFFCADSGQDQYEEVNFITRAGNYGWNVYEGPNPYNSTQSLTADRSFNSTYPIFSVMGYSHSEINKNEGSASIIGGYFYRSKADPCMYGSYLFADLYATAIWAGTESPLNSGNFTKTSIPFACAKDSPLQCESKPETDQPAIGYIYSFGEDNRKDIFLLTSNGVYRIVPPSRCNYTCARENASAAGTLISSPSLGNQLIDHRPWMSSFSTLLLLLAFVF